MYSIEEESQMKSMLIKDTTREEREELVKRSLSYADIGCDDAVNGYDFYLPYIDGEVELRDLNEGYRANYVKSMADEDRRSSGCMMV